MGIDYADIEIYMSLYGVESDLLSAVIVLISLGPAAYFLEYLINWVRHP